MRTPARPRLQTLGEGEWSPKAARPGLGGEEYAEHEGDGKRMNAISTTRKTKLTKTKLTTLIN